MSHVDLVNGGLSEKPGKDRPGGGFCMMHASVFESQFLCDVSPELGSLFAVFLN